MSPSRLMTVIDPLLNTNFLWRYVAAYAGIQCDEQLQNDNGSLATVSTNNRFETIQTSDSERSSLNQQELENEYKLANKEFNITETYYNQLIQMIGSRQVYILRQLRESKLTYHPYMSPLYVSDEILRQFPNTYLIPCARGKFINYSGRFSVKLNISFKDPFIDDNVEFARRLRSLDVPHRLIVVDQLPHGYLDFGIVSNDVANHHARIIGMLQDIVGQSYSDDTDDVTSTETLTF